jgi:hypothetical protein
VADNFQPSVAYTVTFLGPLMQELPALEAARLYCVWGRIFWSLAAERGWPPTTFLSTQAAELFGEPIATPVQVLPRIVAQAFQPVERNELARAVAMEAVGGSSAGRGREVCRWMFSANFQEWSSQTPLSRETLTHPFYKTYLARSDPFFPETIVPFSPDVPLLVVPRVTARHAKRSLPAIELRRGEMTLRKVETLRSWGWEVLRCPDSHCYGTSFGEGLARQWTLRAIRTCVGDSTSV